MTLKKLEDFWRQIRPSFDRFSVIFIGLSIVVVLLIVGLQMFNQNSDDYKMNVYTEAVGVIGTALILDRIYKRNNQTERRKELILQMGSPTNGFAQEAARQLKAIYGHNNRVPLHKSYLVGADLSGADLRFFDLTGSDLRDARLHSIPHGPIANLWRVNFSGAKLTGADLSAAGLREAILSNASCCYANFTGAFLKDADFRGADLRCANLTDIRFTDETGIGIPQMDETTLLPDNTNYVPQAGIEQLRRFTDKHYQGYQNYWLPPGHRHANEGGRTECPEENYDYPFSSH